MITIDLPLEWFEGNRAPESFRPLVARTFINGEKHTLMNLEYRLGSGHIQAQFASHDELELQRIPGLEIQIEMLKRELEKYKS